MIRFLTSLLCFSFFCYTSNLQAYDGIFDQRDVSEEYSYGLSDKDQKKQAVGMVIWGFVMVAFTALITVFTPHSQPTNPDTKESTTTGTGLL